MGFSIGSSLLSTQKPAAAPSLPNGTELLYNLVNTAETSRDVTLKGNISNTSFKILPNSVIHVKPGSVLNDVVFYTGDLYNLNNGEMVIRQGTKNH